MYEESSGRVLGPPRATIVLDDCLRRLSKTIVLGIVAQARDAANGWTGHAGNS